MIVSNIMYAAHAALFYITIFEFICAQTPHSMKGFIIGLAWATTTFGQVIGFVIQTSWMDGWKQPITHPSCAFWYYLSTTFITALFFLIFLVVAKWYTRRERNDPLEVDRRVVEDTFGHYMAPESESELESQESAT